MNQEEHHLRVLWSMDNNIFSTNQKAFADFFIWVQKNCLSIDLELIINPPGRTERTREIDLLSPRVDFATNFPSDFPDVAWMSSQSVIDFNFAPDIDINWSSHGNVPPTGCWRFGAILCGQRRLQLLNDFNFQAPAAENGHV